MQKVALWMDRKKPLSWAGVTVGRIVDPLNQHKSITYPQPLVMESETQTDRGKTWGMWVECSGVPRLKVRLVNPNQKGFSKFYGGFI